MSVPTDAKSIAIWTTLGSPERYDAKEADWQLADEGIVVRKGGRVFLYPWFSVVKVAIEA